MIKNKCINRITSILLILTLCVSSLIYQQKESKSFLLGLTISEFLFSMCASVLMTYCAYDIVDSVTDILTGEVDECLSNEEMYNNIASVNEPFFVETDKYSSFVLDENTINAINSILTSERMQETISNIMRSNYYRIAVHTDNYFGSHSDEIFQRNYFSQKYGTIFNSNLCDLYDDFVRDKFELAGITDKNFICFGESYANDIKTRFYINSNSNSIPIIDFRILHKKVYGADYTCTLASIPFDGNSVHDINWRSLYEETYHYPYVYPGNSSYDTLDCFAVCNQEDGTLKMVNTLPNYSYPNSNNFNFTWFFYDKVPIAFKELYSTRYDLVPDSTYINLFLPAKQAFFRLNSDGSIGDKTYDLISNSELNDSTSETTSEVDISKLSTDEEVKALDYNSVVQKTTEKIKEVAKDKTIPAEKVEAVKKSIAKQNEQVKEKTKVVPSTIDLVTDVIAENVVAQDIADDKVDDPTVGNDPTIPVVPDVGLNDSDLTKVFPFCIPFDFVDMIKALQATPKAPSFKFPIYSINKKYQLKKTGDINVDLSQFDSVASLFRNIMLLVFCIGLMLATKNLVGGGKS